MDKKLWKLSMEERKNKRFKKTKNSIQKHQPVKPENQLIKREDKNLNHERSEHTIKKLMYLIRGTL